MTVMVGLAKLLLASGLGLAALGTVLWATSRVPGLGLAGDLTLRRGHFILHFPLATSVLLSLALTLLLNLLWRR